MSEKGEDEEKFSKKAQKLQSFSHMRPYPF
jgi:hypothetical protein